MALLWNNVYLTTGVGFLFYMCVCPNIFLMFYFTTCIPPLTVTSFSTVVAVVVLNIVFVLSASYSFPSVDVAAFASSVVA